MRLLILPWKASARSCTEVVVRRCKPHPQRCGDTRACLEFFIGASPKAESGMGSWGRGEQPHPHQPWDLEERCELPQRGSGRRRPTTQRFPLLLALRMAFRDTIILLMLDYHAAIGGKTSCSHPCTHRCAYIAACPHLKPG